jgi:hypothetical protein
VLFLGLTFCKNLGFSLREHCEWGTRTINILEQKDESSTPNTRPLFFRFKNEVFFSQGLDFLSSTILLQKWIRVHLLMNIADSTEQNFWKTNNLYTSMNLIIFMIFIQANKEMLSVMSFSAFITITQLNRRKTSKLADSISLWVKATNWKGNFER